MSNVIFVTFILVGAIFTLTVHVAFTLLPSFAFAVIVAVPFATAVTFPLLSTVATPGLLDVHSTALFVAFVGATVAFKVVVAPLLVNVAVVLSNVIFVTFMTSGCISTVTVHVAFTSLSSSAVAVIIAVPSATAVTFPFWSIFAISLLLDVHFTSLIVALSGITVAVRVVVAPLDVKVTASLFKVILVTFINVVSVYCISTVTMHFAFTPLPSCAVAIISAVPSATAVTFPF